MNADNTDLMKEYLRDAFMEGALDLGRDRKFLEGFLRIFQGEMEAAIAIEQAPYLSDGERLQYCKAAKLSKQNLREFEVWRGRVFAPHPQ